MKTRRPLTALALLVSLCWAAPAWAQSVESLFEDGIDAYRRGDVQAAAHAFEAVLAENPGNERAYRLWESAEERVLTEMLIERGEMGRLAERFLQLAQLGRREIVEDPGNAQEVVDRIMTGDEIEREQAMLELRATYGAWAVPALVGPLGASDVKERVLAIQALRRLGSRATLPLVEVLHADDVVTRRNAASVLGALRDPRAAAGLARLAAHDEDETVRAVASDALGELGPSTTDPTALALDLALGFFGGRDELIRPYDSQSVVWSWQEGELVGRPVLTGLFPFELAERFALDALAAGGGEQVRGLLAAIHAAQKAEILAARRIDELEDSDALERAAEELPALDRNIGLAGRHRGLGLLYCLQAENRRIAGAVQLAKAMSASPEELQALTAALEDPEPAVSLAASKALARLNRVDGRVVRRLGSVLAAVPDRLVVSIGETGLGGAASGWQVLASSSVEQGLLRAKAFPPKDVVVVRDGTQGVTLDTMVFGLRNDPRTAGIPIVVVTGEVSEVEDLYGDEVSKVVSRASFADVQEVAGERTAAQRDAIDDAIESARLLAGLGPRLVGEVAAQVDEAIRTVEDEEALVALLDLAAAGEVTAALPGVEARLADEALGTDVRVAAMEAAARLWGVGDGTAGDEVRAALAAALESGDPALEQAAARAMGQLAGLSGAELAAAVE